MKRIFILSVAIIIGLFTSMSAQAKTQGIGGKVIDENGQPLPYVNVVLLSLPDSAFVQGAMTDEQGIFNIVTNHSQGLLKLSSSDCPIRVMKLIKK